MKEEIAVKESEEVAEIPAMVAPEILVEKYEGISSLSVNEKQSNILLEPVTISEIEIKPTGEIYMCHIQHRRRLNAAFGIGQWALKPIGGFVKTSKTNYGKTQQTVCREYALYISGRFAASAIGEATYIEENAQMTWSDACEATKSNALMRCCKDIGIGLEMWDRKFVEQFKRENCIQVWRKNSQKPQWRLKTSEPFYDETQTGQPASSKPATQPPESTVPETIQVKTSIVSVAKETKKNKTGKDFFVYHLSDKDGNVFSTTEEYFITKAKEAKEDGLDILLTHKNDTYKTITGIEKIEPDLDIDSKKGIAGLQEASNALARA